jgi:hypothetical protein
MTGRKLSYPNFKTMRQALRETEVYFTDLMGQPCTIDRDDFLDWYFVNADKCTIRQALRGAILASFKQLAEKNPEGPIELHDNGNIRVKVDKPLPDHMYWVIHGKYQPKRDVAVQELNDGQA